MFFLLWEGPFLLCTNNFNIYMWIEMAVLGFGNQDVALPRAPEKISFHFLSLYIMGFHSLRTYPSTNCASKLLCTNKIPYSCRK